MTFLLAVVYVLTVYRLTRLVTTDTFPPVAKAREWALIRWPSDDTTYTSEYVTATSGEQGVTDGGAEVFWDHGEWAALNPHWIGELVTCMWCASVWVAALALPFFYLWPDVMMWAGLIPAASAVAGIIDTRG